MTGNGSHNLYSSLEYLGINTSAKAFWNLSSEDLVFHSLHKNLGVLADNGALVIKTGKFTGRSPKDRYIVKDEITSSRVDWGIINQPVSKEVFGSLAAKVKQYLSDKDLYIKDGMACADETYRLNVRIVAEYPWSAQFVSNMFLRPDEKELTSFAPDWNILCAPGFHANPAIDGITNDNFAIINFTEKKVIIGGTGYTGEIKKGIFSVLNFLLPVEHDVFPMHCSANVGSTGDTAIFFGLSGTGKTTLSADPERELIGDDEHGWSNDSVFNFEGGCYAKTIDLSEEKEPDIYRAIKPGAILENIGFKAGTNVPDYEDDTITQNTRVSYPIYHIDNAQPESKGKNPKNIFFLTCDAFGVLPPIAKLTTAQAMYYFISGYTAKIAGTEEGIVDPVATFSACFGAPFLPLHPTEYAEMLGNKMESHDVSVWLINTGWTGGPYGVGSRIKLRYTRAMIHAALNGDLSKGEFQPLALFSLNVPVSCPDVPEDILNPRNTWTDKGAYDAKSAFLAKMFKDNFVMYADKASSDILTAAPTLNENTLA